MGHFLARGSHIVNHVSCLASEAQASRTIELLCYAFLSEFRHIVLRACHPDVTRGYSLCTCFFSTWPLYLAILYLHSCTTLHTALDALLLAGVMLL